MKKIVHKPAAPIYAAAVVWILYALLFPLYRVGHFALCAAASAAVYLGAHRHFPPIIQYLSPTVKKKRRRPPRNGAPLY